MFFHVHFSHPLLSSMSPGLRTRSQTHGGGGGGPFVALLLLPAVPYAALVLARPPFPSPPPRFASTGWRVVLGGKAERVCRARSAQPLVVVPSLPPPVWSPPAVRSYSCVSVGQ